MDEILFYVLYTLVPSVMGPLITWFCRAMFREENWSYVSQLELESLDLDSIYHRITD